MPAKIKATKEMIINAAFEIAREIGAENINARTSVKLSTLLILFIRILPATLSVLKLSCFFAIVFSPPFPLNNFMKPLFSS